MKKRDGGREAERERRALSAVCPLMTRVIDFTASGSRTEQGPQGTSGGGAHMKKVPHMEVSQGLIFWLEIRIFIQHFSVYSHIVHILKRTFSYKYIP